MTREGHVRFCEGLEVKFLRSTHPKLLGHRSPVMTQRYAHHCSESLRDGVNVLDRVEANTNPSHPDQEPGVMNS